MAVGPRIHHIYFCGFSEAKTICLSCIILFIFSTWCVLSRHRHPVVPTGAPDRCVWLGSLFCLCLSSLCSSPTATVPKPGIKDRSPKMFSSYHERFLCPVAFRSCLSHHFPPSLYNSYTLACQPSFGGVTAAAPVGDGEEICLPPLALCIVCQQRFRGQQQWGVFKKGGRKERSVTLKWPSLFAEVRKGGNWELQVEEKDTRDRKRREDKKRGEEIILIINYFYCCY